LRYLRTGRSSPIRDRHGARRKRWHNTFILKGFAMPQPSKRSGEQPKEVFKRFSPAIFPEFIILPAKESTQASKTSSRSGNKRLQMDKRWDELKRCKITIKCLRIKQNVGLTARTIA